MSNSLADQNFPSLGDRYEVKAFLGGGSTGRVYRARDLQLDRTVAVKILRASDPAEIERFQHEARAQARIDHEHVCRIFDVDTVGDTAFIAMQFIDGETLREAAPMLELEDKVEAVEQAARAVQAAHASGVIHSDLKPGNVMVERRPDGRVHAVVLDFGIARAVAAPDDSLPAMSSGTPAFMAPEQVRADPTDHRVDVYGLGAMLYGVVAEQVPYFGTTRAEVKDRILAGAPTPLGLVVPGTPEDLETVVDVAMAGQPARRYPTAGALAADLARWRTGEPIRARAGGPLYRCVTWVRSHRVLAAAAAVLIVAIAGVLGLGLKNQIRAAQRVQLIDRYHTEVEAIDRLLRRARMMPLHDTTAAEDAVRRRLAAVEASLAEHGPVARGQAYYALGFGLLMLRDFATAEQWLSAAVEAGANQPEIRSALGIAQAMQILNRGAGNAAPNEIDEAVTHLSARGERTADRDRFHRALALFVRGDVDQAVLASRDAAAATPWLYEAFQLEGDALVARAAGKESRGDLDGALADLEAAGSAYTAGLELARSDPWLYEADADRLEKAVELRLRRGDAEGDDREILELRRRVDRRRAESRSAKPR